MRIKPEETMALIIDYQTKLARVMDQKEILDRNLEILIRGLKALKIPMAITQQYTKGLGESEEMIYEAAETREYLEKNSFSCMQDEGIRAAVENSHCKNVLICGIEAHICVLQTCIDLKAAGYQPVLVTDCISSRTAQNKKLGIERAIQEGVIVTSYEAILFELMVSSKHPAFKTVSKLIK